MSAFAPVLDGRNAESGPRTVSGEVGEMNLGPAVHHCMMRCIRGTRSFYDAR